MNKGKTKILYIAHSPHIGGGEKCLLTLLKMLNRDRFEPIVVVIDNGSFRTKVEKLGIKCYVVPFKWWVSSSMGAMSAYQVGIMERCNEVASIIEAEGVDIVHTNSSVVAEGAIAAKMTGRVHIWHLHEILEGHPSLKPPMSLFFTYKFIELMSDAVVVVSKAHKEAIEKWIDGDKIEIIYNGIEDFEEEGFHRSLRDELKIPKDFRLICTIGPILQEKGYDTFVDVAEKVLNEVKNVHFISVGSKVDQQLWSSIKERVNKKSLQKHISFLGFRNDIGRILKDVDIYLLTSETETFSLATLEAMSMGKPVIATRCGGPEEIVVDGETGYLVRLKDSGALSQAIVLLLKNQDEMARLGKNAICRYEKLFKAEKYIERFEKFYKGMGEKEELSEKNEYFVDSLINQICYAPPEIKEMEKHIQNIMNSLSWRITAPLRKIMNLFLR